MLGNVFVRGQHNVLLSSRNVKFAMRSEKQLWFFLQRNLTEYCNAVNLHNMIAMFAR